MPSTTLGSVRHHPSAKPSVLDNTEPGPSKRQKIDIACNICKARKSKCDGRRPVCGPCSSRRRGRDAHACSYRSVEARVASPRHRESSSDRLIRLRGSSSGQEDVTSAEGSQPNTAFPEHHSHTHHATFSNSAGGRAQIDQPDRGEVLTPSSPAPSDGSAKDRDVDAMGCVDPWALRNGLLGTASGASLLRQVRKVAEGSEIADPGGAQGSRSNHVSNPLSKLRRQRTQEDDPETLHFVLPPRKTADQLFNVYWDYSDPIFPWLDRAEISQQYASLWTVGENTDMDEKVFHCILNLMFAIASRLDPEGKPETQSRLAGNYYARAKALLNFNLLDISHFQIIQALLLTAQYLQSTNMPRQCFQAIGMAIWIAQDMGLHLPKATERLTDPHERELARRVWHGCIVMDKSEALVRAFLEHTLIILRIAAMTFGRPARISNEIASQAVYPLADETSPGSLATKPAKLAFFIAYCKLHYILGAVLDSFYIMRSGSSTPSHTIANTGVPADRLCKVVDIERDLATWLNGLDEHLKVPSAYEDESETLYITRQANILNARQVQIAKAKGVLHSLTSDSFLYTRLLLFRPFLTQVHELNHPRNTEEWSLELPASAAFVVQCQVLCVQSAQSIIELLIGNLPARPEDRRLDVLPAWWYTIAYVHSASLVLIAAHMFPAILAHIPSSALNDSLEHGYQILRHYESHTKSANRCRSALESAQNRLPNRQLRALFCPDQAVDHQNGRPDGEPDDNQYPNSTFPLDEDLSWLGTEYFNWTTVSLESVL